MVILSHSELAELLWLLRSIQLKSNFGRFQKPGYQFWNIMKQSKLQFYILVTPQFNFRYGESIYTQAMLKQPCGNMSYLAWEMKPWQLTFQHFHSYFHHRLRATQSVRSPFDYFSKSTRSKDSTWTQRRALFISESNSLISLGHSSMGCNSCVERAHSLSQTTCIIVISVVVKQKNASMKSCHQA